MSHAALTARYRPQTFAEVAGQDTIKTILSRASLEGRVAAAYLFSGTRGVGKTTLARIFAKALNCRTAPAAEPCNQCDQCRSITAGNAVDVVEIDGASNRGIDDVRRLKEVVGYAPMEGSYKIFIIDEAHMLSREAFNALLKTLEEPPAKVTFVMATTEPHKFPATIISRCQHYVFKRLPEGGLVQHLSRVLEKEGVEFDESALRLIARRGAGSVRDSMSLLGQVLALGEGRLTESATRSVLGLAGQEAFMRMLEAFKNGDSIQISRLLHEMLDQGLDMGFFLRELASLWRNLFMLRQSGEAALPVVELPEKEGKACLALAQDFSLQHIHACWQMTLEGQRRVLTSLEPALALELLLLNIAMLPQLLSLEKLSALGKKGGASAPPAPSEGGAPSRSGASGPSGREGGSSAANAAPRPGAMPAYIPQPEGEDAAVPESSPGIAPVAGGAASSRTHAAQPAPVPLEAPLSAPPEEMPEEAHEADIQAALTLLSAMESDPPGRAPAEDALPDPQADPQADHAGEPEGFPPSAEASDKPVESSALAREAEKSLPDWRDIMSHCEENAPAWLLQLLRRVQASENNGKLRLTAQDEFSAERLRDAEAQKALRALMLACCALAPDMEIVSTGAKLKTREDLRSEIMGHPLVREVEAQLGACIIDYGQMR